MEKLWEITENLNILYKDNWTALASLELGRLSDAVRRHGAQLVSSVSFP